MGLDGPGSIDFDWIRLIVAYVGLNRLGSYWVESVVAWIGLRWIVVPDCFGFG